MCQHWFSHPALFWHFLSISLHLPLDLVSVFLLTSHDTMAQSSLLPLTWGISIQRGQYVEVGGHFPNALGNVLWNKDSLCKPYYSNCRLKQLFFSFFFFPPVWMILAKRAWNETMGGSCFLFLRVAACHQHWVEQRGRLECYSPAAHPCSLSSGISHCLVKARASLCFQRHHFWASNFSPKETKLKQCVAVWGRDIPWLNPTVRRKLKVANVST